MWLVAASASGDGNSSIPTTLILLVVGGFIYSFGYLRSRLHAANNAYKNSKASVKPLRKAFWVMFLRTAQVGAVILIAFGLLFFWVWHDVTEEDADNHSVPASSVAPSPTR
jgi:hypothetical protein